MVLDLIVIGVGIYLLARHKRTKRERAAAYAAGQPIYNEDGSVTYPPGYQGCPTHGGTQRQRGGYYDEKQQHQHQHPNHNQQGYNGALPGYDAGQQGQRQEEVPRYTDAVSVPVKDQKGGVLKEPEVREVRNEKEDYVRV